MGTARETVSLGAYPSRAGEPPVSHEFAKLLVAAMGLYLSLGAIFAVGFALRWAGRLDPVAREGSTGFRLLILPGAMLLWPYLAFRLVKTR
jgi:hypothetical protein